MPRGEDMGAPSFPGECVVCRASVCVRAAGGEKRRREEVEAPVPSSLSLSLYPPFLTSHMLQPTERERRRGPFLRRLPSRHRQAAANGDPRRRRPIISFSNGRFPPPPPAQDITHFW